MHRRQQQRCCARVVGQATACAWPGVCEIPNRPQQQSNTCACQVNSSGCRWPMAAAADQNCSRQLVSGNSVVCSLRISRLGAVFWLVMAALSVAVDACRLAAAIVWHQFAMWHEYTVYAWLAAHARAVETSGAAFVCCDARKSKPTWCCAHRCGSTYA